MQKYRIRLKNGRVIGPFLESQVIELKQKGHISGEEECQVFPAGNWIDIRQFEFFHTDKTQVQDENTVANKTFVVNLDKLKKKVATGPAIEPIEKIIELPPQEPSFPKAFNYHANSNEVTGPLNASDEPAIELEVEEIAAPPATPQTSITQKVSDFEDHLDKTIVKTTPSVTTDTSADKTIVKPETLEFLKKMKAEEAKKAAEKARIEEVAKLQAIEEEKNRVDLNNDSTQMISLGQVKAVLKDEAKRGEIELAEEAEISQQLKKEKETKKRKEIEAQEAEERKKVEDEEKANRKAAMKKKIVLTIIGIALALMFLDDGKEKKKKVEKYTQLDPQIIYPVPFDVADNKKYEDLMKKAKEAYETGDYAQRVKAAQFFREAYENDNEKSEALGRMIRSYGELLAHSGKHEEDASTLFKLLQANRIRMDVNPEINLGASLFYEAIGKKETAYQVVDRFIISNVERKDEGSAKPTKELYAHYAQLLIKQGNLEKADKTLGPLRKIEGKKGLEVELALISYHLAKDEKEEALKLIANALKDYPGAAALQTVRGEIEVMKNDEKALTQTTLDIWEDGAEGSRLYYGKFLGFMGLIRISQGKIPEAAKYFKEALLYEDSDLIRKKLLGISNVDVAAEDEASILIKQVQAKEYCKNVEDYLEKRDYKSALLEALKATGLRSGLIQANLLLARVQLKLGYTAEALKTLEELHKEYGTDTKVNFEMLNAYVETYKFSDAKKLIAIMAASEMRNRWEYASANAQLYQRMGDSLQAINWLQKSINMNPLNDKNLFSLAEMFMKIKKFDQAKNLIYKAQELDPANLDYKIAYAGIVYETDSVDAAISYLFGILKNYPQNPAVLGEIAIYYYRAGKIAEFNNTKKDIESLTTRDPGIYRFLIKASLMEEKIDEAVQYTKELIELEPGDLAAMMDIGKALMEAKKYKEASDWFIMAKNKLPTYPRVGYYEARIRMLMGENDQALKNVEDDMKNNGEYEEGLVLMGDIKRNQEKWNEAENYYKQAQKLNPRSVLGIMGLAYISFKKGQFEVSLDLYKRVAKEQPGNPEVHRQLAEVYRFLGQSALAVESYKLYLELVPNAPDKAQVESAIRALE